MLSLFNVIPSKQLVQKLCIPSLRRLIEFITLREAAVKLKLVTGKEFDKIVDPKKMI